LLKLARLPHHEDGIKFLQRLFSTFPGGWPGFGLLLLRIGVSAALIGLGANGFLGVPGEPASIARGVIEAAGGIFLIAGLWTPATGALLAVDELWIALSLYSPQGANHWIHLFLAVLTAGLAMVGPGASSIDARLFGRTRFDIDKTRGRKSSH